MPEIDTKNFTRLNQVSCGEVVHIQIITPTKPIRLKTRLIGIDPNMSVILAFGSDASWEKALPHIKESKTVIVRLLSNEKQQASIIAFRTKIQKIMTIAGRWLVLNYPQVLELAELRQHLRIPVNIEASLLDPTLNESISVGFLSDISMQGCAFIGERKTLLKVDKLYRLSIKLEGEAKAIELPITLKNIQHSAHEDETQYGLVFTEPDKAVTGNIQQLLLHHLQQ